MFLRRNLFLNKVIKKSRKIMIIKGRYNNMKRQVSKGALDKIKGGFIKIHKNAKNIKILSAKGS